MKKQYIIILAISIFFLGKDNTAFAQMGNTDGGAMAYFQIGNSGMDLSKLNTPLKAVGYGAIPENFLTLGGGGHIFYKRLVLGGEGSSFIVNIANNANNAASARLSGGHGFGNIGYLLHSGARWKIYPMLGIGGGNYKLEIAQDQSAATTMNSLLSKPQNLYDEKLQTGGFLLNLSLNISTALKVNGGKGGPIILGIRGGYIVQPWMNPWTYDYSDVPSSSMGMKGWYAMFQIGFGGWAKHPKATENTLPDMPLPEN